MQFCTCLIIFSENAGPTTRKKAKLQKDSGVDEEACQQSDYDTEDDEEASQPLVDYDNEDDEEASQPLVDEDDEEASQLPVDDDIGDYEDEVEMQGIEDLLQDTLFSHKEEGVLQGLWCIIA